MQQHLTPSPPLYGYNESTGGFSPLADNGAQIYTPGGITGGGQVATLLMRLIANASGKAVKLFAGGYTGQGVDFMRRNSPTKHIYGNGTSHPSMNNFELTRHWVETSGEQVELIVLIGGEADAGGGQTQAAHYARLRELVIDHLIVHPIAHVILVKTIETGGGVRAAQDQVAAEFAHVHILINDDMAGNTAWYGDNGSHFSSYAGYEEVALRLYALVAGLAARPAVAAVDHIKTVMPLTHLFHYRHSEQTGQTIAWADDIAAISAQAAGALCYGHVANDPLLSNRPSNDSERSGSETMSVVLADTLGCDKWTAVAVGTLESVVQTMRLLELRDAGAANRISFTLVGQFNAAAILVGAAVTVVFPGGTAGIEAGVPHVWGFVYDGPNLVARYYVDGVRIAEVAVLGTEEIQNATLWIGSLAGSQDFFDGQLSLLGLASNYAADDAAMALAFDYCEVEYPVF